MADLKHQEQQPKSAATKSIPFVELNTLINDIELPWPEDIFGGFDKWSELDEFLKTLGYRVDNVSAELMRRGWKVFKRQLTDRVTDIADD